MDDNPFDDPSPFGDPTPKPAAAPAPRKPADDGEGTLHGIGAFSHCVAFCPACD